MNTFFFAGDWISNAVTERLGWMLVHSLWQFALIAAVGWGLMRLLRRWSASARYNVLLCGLVAMIAAPVATYALLEIRPSAEPTVDIMSLAVDSAVVASEERRPEQTAALAVPVAPAAESQLPPPAPLTSPALFNTQADGYTRFSLPQLLRPWFGELVTLWCLGVLLLSLRPLISWLTIRRLRTKGVSEVPQDIRELLGRAAARIGLRRTVRVLQSTLVGGPAAIGYLRPIILLPVSAVTGLPANQLEAILAHELAHIRRHDYAVNFVQVLFETLFFYHPAVWWLSQRIRVERENCCDDFVVASLDNRVAYSRALIAIAELPAAGTSLALGANDGTLSSRIARITGFRTTGSVSSPWTTVCLTACCVAAFWGLASVNGYVAAAADDPKQSAQADEKLPDFGPEMNGLRCRLVPVSPDSDDEAPDVTKAVGEFASGDDVTFAVELKNVSDEPVMLFGTQYGDSYGEAQGKLNASFFAPHFFEFQFTDLDGKPIQSAQRTFVGERGLTLGASKHYITPGESVIWLLRPARFIQPMGYHLPRGQFRATVRYQRPEGSLIEVIKRIKKRQPDKPLAKAWPHNVTSNPVEFIVKESPEAPKLNWGPVTDGLQAAIEFQIPTDVLDDPSAAPGVPLKTKIGVVFHVKNVGDRPVTFVSETGRQGDFIQVLDAAGKKVQIRGPFMTNWPIDVRWSLKPGELARLPVLAPALDTIELPGQYKVSYTIRFNSREKKDPQGKIIFPLSDDWQGELETGETPLFLRTKAEPDAALEPDAPPKFSDETQLKLKRSEAVQDRWFFVDLDQGSLKTPPFPIEISTESFPLKIIAPEEQSVKKWFVDNNVDLIIGMLPMRANDGVGRRDLTVHTHSIRTLLKSTANGLQPHRDGSWTWNTQPQEVVDAFQRKNDVLRVAGFSPDSSSGGIRADSPDLRLFRTAENRLGLYLLEAANKSPGELRLRLVHVTNCNKPLQDISFGDKDVVFGNEAVQAVPVPVAPASDLVEGDNTSKTTKIVWGDPVDGIRLGIRPKPTAKHNTRFRYGDWLWYEVWIKNASDETIHIHRDLGHVYGPLLRDNEINVAGGQGWSSFGMPLEALNETLTLRPGQFHQLLSSVQTCVRPVGEQRGRMVLEPLCAAPGKYPLLAALDVNYFRGGVYDARRRDGKNVKLRSPRSEIQILPAARVQLRRARRRAAADTAKFLAQDQNLQVLGRYSGEFGNDELVIDKYHEVLLDQDDIASVAVIANSGRDNQSSIRLQLTPTAAQYFAESVRGLPREKTYPLLAASLDGKFIGTTPLDQTFADGWVTITGDLSRAQAEQLATAIRPVVAEPIKDKGKPADAEEEAAPQPKTEVDGAEADLPDIELKETQLAAGGMKDLAGRDWGTVTLRSTKLSVEELRHADSIRTLRLFGGGLSGNLGRLGHVNGLVGLEIGAPLMVRDLIAVGESLPHLQHLKLPQELALTVTGAQQIAHLTNLKSLNLYGVDVDDAAFAELAPLVNLEELDLTHTRVTDNGLKVLVQMPKLKSLDLYRHPAPFIPQQLSDECLSTICQLKDLETLTLSGQITDAGLVQIAILPRLRRLMILNTSISPDGLVALTDSSVEHLSLPSNLIRGGASSVSILKKCKSLKSIRAMGTFREQEFRAWQRQAPGISWAFSDR